jgi:hypothetical protein
VFGEGETMWRDVAHFEEFPTLPSNHRVTPASRGWIEAINLYAGGFLEIIIAAAPAFYVTLFLAYLAVIFGVV